jgi:hypothetical protein
LKHAEKKVICLIIISEEVITLGEVRERIKETVSKTCERNRQGKRKPRKTREW